MLTRSFPFWRAVLAAVLMLGPLLAACGGTPAPPTPTAAPVIPPTSTLLPTQPVPVSETPGIEPGQLITLTIWTTEELAPYGQASPAAPMLGRQLATFFTSRPGVRIQSLIKKPSGTGGLYDFLETASAVAPATVPDLMILDAAELPKATSAGLIQPLDDVVGPAADQLFPFARDLATVNGSLMGMPYIVNAEHVAYDPTRFDAPPLTWGEVISAGVRFAFPVGDDDHVDNLISLYLAAGGTLTDSSGAPHLETGPLADVLRLLADARRAGVTANVAQMNSAEDSWAAYRAGTPLAVVDAERYLADRGNIGAVAAGPLPGQGGPAASLGTTWVWVLVSRDPVREPLAEELLNHLTAPQNVGAWSRAAGRVPARRDALTTWEANSTVPDAYIPVLQNVLEDAIARPPATLYSAIAPALREAAADVLAGRATPTSAAATAARNVEK
jgi:ABC-type glycerol-3-phosphate transport system substrate-binding protein